MSEDKKVIKVTGFGDKSGEKKPGAKIDIYSKDPKKGPHDSIHITVDPDKCTFNTVTKINGKSYLYQLLCLHIKI